MFRNKIREEICFILPEDGVKSQAYLLQLFNENVSEVYILAYGFNLDSLYEKILVLDSKSIPVHILIDYVQARSPYTWNKLIELKKKLKFGDITLTSAGTGSPNKSAIWHLKALLF